MAVNSGRVISGGLVAGVVSTALGFVAFGWLMKDRMAVEMNALNSGLLAKANAPEGIVGSVVQNFVVGIALVWIYASIRQTYGPGPRTAMRAGLVIWILFGAIYAGMTAMGMYTWSFFWTATPVSLVTTMLTALAGGAAYKE